jgi:hypothetical protein
VAAEHPEVVLRREDPHRRPVAVGQHRAVEQDLLVFLVEAAEAPVEIYRERRFRRTIERAARRAVVPLPDAEVDVAARPNVRSRVEPGDRPALDQNRLDARCSQAFNRPQEVPLVQERLGGDEAAGVIESSEE